MSNEIQTIDEQKPITAEFLIQQAVSGNSPVETIEKLLAMRKELKAEWAKEQFDEAMAKFQAECPVIKKKKAGGKTKSGGVAYYYAPIESIVEQTKDLIAKNGLSYAIKIETQPDKVKAICIVKHKAGHSEQSEMEAPLTTKTEIMSQPQVFAATATFVKRYAFCNAFGIMTGEDDTDAKDGKNIKLPLVQEVIKKIKEAKPEKIEEMKKWIEERNYTEAQKKIMFRAIEEKQNETK